MVHSGNQNVLNNTLLINNAFFRPKNPKNLQKVKDATHLQTSANNILYSNIYQYLHSFKRKFVNKFKLK